MRIAGVVQARMGSSRLPGKVLLPLGGRSVLGWLVRAVRESQAVDSLVVATSTDPVDDQVVAECERLAVPVCRGPVDDVLTRFIGALDAFPGDAVMRFTADTPLLDPEIIAMGAAAFRAVPGLDYLSTSITRMLPYGLNVEVIRADTLRALDLVATGYHRVHVTTYAYENPDQFRVLGLTLPPDRTHQRLTLDTAEDWRLIQAVVDHFGDATIPAAKVIDWLDANPAIRDLNTGVAQKRPEEM